MSPSDMPGSSAVMRSDLASSTTSTLGWKTLGLKSPNHRFSTRDGENKDAPAKKGSRKNCCISCWVLSLGLKPVLGEGDFWSCVFFSSAFLRANLKGFQLLRFMMTSVCFYRSYQKH